MHETWIQPNRRALWFGAIVPVGLLIGSALVFAVALEPQASYLWMLLAGLLLGIGLVAVTTLWQMLTQPRVAYRNGELWLYLHETQPFRLPIDVVECFFRGQAESLLKNAQGQEAEVATIIVRIADAAKDWHHKDIKPALGMWCEGYVTIRGTWCEPITPELLKRLNQRLVEVQRERKQQLQEQSYG